VASGAPKVRARWRFGRGSPAKGVTRRSIGGDPGHSSGPHLGDLSRVTDPEDQKGGVGRSEGSSSLEVRLAGCARPVPGDGGDSLIDQRPRHLSGPHPGDLSRMTAPADRNGVVGISEGAGSPEIRLAGCTKPVLGDGGRTTRSSGTSAWSDTVAKPTAQSGATSSGRLRRASRRSRSVRARARSEEAAEGLPLTHRPGSAKEAPSGTSSGISSILERSSLGRAGPGWPIAALHPRPRTDARRALRPERGYGKVRTP
jgi:hypothetical protein